MELPVRKFDLSLTPQQLLGELDSRVPVLMLHSGRFDATWSRYSIVGFPKTTYQFSQDGKSQLVGETLEQVSEFSDDPFDDLRTLVHANEDGVWIGYLSYDLGRWVEDLPTQAMEDRGWPILEFGFCPTYLVYDHANNTWQIHGDAADLPELNSHSKQTHAIQPAKPQSVFERFEYEAAVKQCIDYIHAGDVFQVNLTQRFSTKVNGQFPQTPRQIFAKLMEHSPAWYAAHLELAGNRSIISSSPELFLQVDSGGHVITRPIKGTRPASSPVSELQNSLKDQAELYMIVDLMRNDLGRVCQFGSIQVTAPRQIESHPTVHHGVATLEGDLQTSKDQFDLLRATMPGGSITGAPKVRAMQIIDELEPVRRGPYCGSIGYLTARHGSCLNIAIRTMLLEQISQNQCRIDYSVGGGVVSDSDPADEYEETRTKARGMEAALGL